VSNSKRYAFEQVDKSQLPLPPHKHRRSLRRPPTPIG
jgi:hypothetical protein